MATKRPVTFVRKDVSPIQYSIGNPNPPSLLGRFRDVLAGWLNVRHPEGPLGGVMPPGVNQRLPWARQAQIDELGNHPLTLRAYKLSLGSNGQGDPQTGVTPAMGFLPVEHGAYHMPAFRPVEGQAPVRIPGTP